MLNIYEKDKSFLKIEPNVYKQFKFIVYKPFTNRLGKRFINRLGKRLYTFGFNVIKRLAQTFIHVYITRLS